MNRLHIFEVLFKKYSPICECSKYDSLVSQGFRYFWEIWDVAYIYYIYIIYIYKIFYIYVHTHTYIDIFN